ncbi:MAG: thiamine phosphate synthase, partial [Deltaproteobacteria bacterium]
VACVRLSLASRDEDVLLRSADMLRDLCHARDVSVVIDNHLVLAERLGLDGVHLTDSHRKIREARAALGPDAIIGCFCGTSRHDGISAAEAGADYVAFGPLAGNLGDGTLVDPELFAWWSEMIEIPVVAEGGISEDAIKTFAPITDFFALGDEIWLAEDPVAQAQALAALLK